MRTRRIPSGSLAALAVLLAALAVVVVAGARTTLIRTIVDVPAPVTPPAVTPTTARHTVVASHHGARHGTGAGVIEGQDATGQPGSSHHAQPPSTPTTSSSTSTTTTTTTSTTTTTTTQPAAVAMPSHRGTFQGGQTTVVQQLGAVHAVTASVPRGIRVTLLVTCGIVQSSGSDTTSVTVMITSASTTCTATIHVPASAPEPATWQLVTR